jgi:DHA3 family macrolide efflux protein-like MFS transporter
LSLLALFRNKNFSFFFFGQSISRLGDSIYTLALVWMAHELANSTLLMSTVLAAAIVPRIFIAPVMGVLVERWSKKAAMIVSDLVRGTLLIVLTGMAFTHTATAWALIAVSFILSTMSTVATPAYMVLQKVIVPKELLMKANSINQTVLNLTQIVGPAIAGVLIWLFGLGILFFIDAVSFFVSVATMWFVFADEPARSKTPLTMASVLGEMMSGVKIFWSFPMVRALTPSMIMYTFAVVAVENLLIVQFIANTLRVPHPTATIGVISTSMAIGELTGSLLVSYATSRWSKEKLLVFNMVVASICVCGVGFSTSVPLICILFFIAGLCASITNITFFTGIQEAVPSEALGRVWAILSAVFNAVIPISQLLFGGIAAFVPIGLLISLLGAFGALAGASAFLNPFFRKIHVQAEASNTQVS